MTITDKLRKATPGIIVPERNRYSQEQFTEWFGLGDEEKIVYWTQPTYWLLLEDFLMVLFGSIAALPLMLYFLPPMIGWLNTIAAYTLLVTLLVGYLATEWYKIRFRFYLVTNRGVYNGWNFVGSDSTSLTFSEVNKFDSNVPRLYNMISKITQISEKPPTIPEVGHVECFSGGQSSNINLRYIEKPREVRSKLMTKKQNIMDSLTEEELANAVEQGMRDSQK